MSGLYKDTLSESHSFNKWALTAITFTKFTIANLNTQPVSGGNTTIAAGFPERGREQSQVSSPRKLTQKNPVKKATTLKQLGVIAGQLAQPPPSALLYLYPALGLSLIHI